VEAMVMRDAQKGVARELKKAFGPLNRTRGGLIDIKVEIEAPSLPEVRKYVEEKIRQRSTCDNCGFHYAVYGISYHCPLCGKGTIRAHLRESFQTVKVLASEAERIGRELGAPAERLMLGNAYEDVVSFFEGFLKRIYGYSVERKYGPEKGSELFGKVRTNFQRLDGAKEFFRRDLQFHLFDDVEDHDLSLLQVVFCKRHVLTHNLGLVDGKYLDQAKAWQREGEEVPLDAKEVEEGVLVVERLVSSAAEDLGL